jgi:carboxylate-amine ligase
MALPVPPLTLGVEEEYQIIDPETRNLHSYISKFLSQDETRPTKLNLQPELMQSQVEVGTRVCHNVKEVRQEVIRLRREVVELAHENGLEIAAASTHPFARWANGIQIRRSRLRDRLEGDENPPHGPEEADEGR